MKKVKTAEHQKAATAAKLPEMNIK